MKELKDIQAVYFLGIGGIGMSALARYFNSKGIRVSGYDKTPTPLTNKLQQEGIEIHFDDNLEKINPHADLVVYTPAVPKDHAELNFYKSNGYEIWKRSDVLGFITRGKENICVAGTHGKTTTSAMIAHVLRNSGKGCNAFLGGVASNYDTNFWSSDNDLCVAEADEYDRSFLKLEPTIGIITAMDADHLDIYGNEKNMQDAFIEFASRVKENGWLIVKEDIQRIDEFKASNVVKYSLKNAQDIKIENGSYRYNINVNGEQWNDVLLNMGGLHNIENSIAATIALSKVGLSADAIKNGLASFKGVKRRFEYLVKNESHVVIDDYAHHPEELRALIEGAKNLFPDKKCTVVFQPHLYTRTRDLADGFAEVLSLADETILLPIYPARELPIDGVSSEMVLNKMKPGNRWLLQKSELLNWIKENDTELLITSGAGDIDALTNEIKNIVETRSGNK